MLDAFYQRLNALRWKDAVAPPSSLSQEFRFIYDPFLPAHSHFRIRQYRQIRQELSDAVPAVSGNEAARAHAALGRLGRLLGEKNFESHFDQALRLDPSCASARAFEGEAQIALNPAKALSALRLARTLDPTDAGIPLWQGFACFLLSQWPLAEALFTTSISLDPSMSAASILRGLTRGRMENWALAEADLSKAAELLPHCPGVHILRSKARFNSGAENRAVEDAHRALLMHPDASGAFGFILQRQKGCPPIDGAAELIFAADAYLKRNPDCAWAYAIRSEGFRRKAPHADLRQCRENLERSVSLDPNQAWTRAFLARALASNAASPTFEPDKALEHINAAVALAPKSGWIRAWQASVHHRKNELGRALEGYDAAIALDPYYRVAYGWRAEIKEKLGDLTGAEADMRICLEVPQRHSLYKRHAALLKALGRQEEARQVEQKAALAAAGSLIP